MPLRPVTLLAILAAFSCRSHPTPPPVALSLTALYTPKANAAPAGQSIPSGVGWQGLSGIYRETLVSRAPEVMRFVLRLPDNPWLDLNIGTVEDGPVTFRVSAVLGESSQFGEPTSTLLLERTVTRAHRWEPAGVDLSPFSGRKITLALSLVAGTPASSSPGLWGSPVVRDRWRPMRNDGPQGVIVVWADALRRDHLGAYGSTRATSPQIDRLAAEGTLFDACVGGATLPATATTLAEVYRNAGYATVSYSSIPLTGPMSNLHQGFDEVHEPGSLPAQESSKTAREYVDRLLPWLTAHKDVPFFVFLHVSDPHDPSDGSIRAMDAEIGRLMERLNSLGLARKSLVALTGDHGEPTNVPLILHRPGSIAAGSRVAETVESMDIVPTLLTLSGLPVPPQTQGASLAPLLTGPRR
jgi:hypothetical protein